MEDKLLTAVGEIFDGLTRLLVLEDNSLRHILNGLAGGCVGFVSNGIAYNGLQGSPRDIGRVRYFGRTFKVNQFHSVNEEGDEDEPQPPPYIPTRTGELAS